MDTPQEEATELSVLFDTSRENAERIWQEFFPRLVGLARAKLGALPKRVYDEEDVALSAMKSYFRARDQGRLANVDGREELWRLLALITTRKVIAVYRKRRAPTKPDGKVAGESAFINANQESEQVGIAGVADLNLLPECTEQIMSDCEELLKMLPDDKHRRTAVMRLEGYSNQEISEELECSVARTKQRFQRVREIWADQ